MKRIAGICVLVGASLALNAQQKAHSQPPKTKTTVSTKKTVVPAKKAPPKGVTVIKKVVTTKTVTTKVVGQSHQKPVAHRIVRRHVRRRVRYARRRSHHYRVAIHTVSGGVSSSVETGLVGVHLFDSGLKVLGMYGNPSFILNLGQTPSTGGAGPAGGGGGGGFGAGGGGGFGPGGPGGPGGGFGGRMGGKGGPGRAPNLGEGQDIPPTFSDSNSDLQAPGALGRFGGRGGAMFGGGQGQGQEQGGSPFGPGGPMGGGGFQQNGGSNAPAPEYVQWIYKESAAQYTFILDQHDRVVQIEAVGLDDPKVRTNHGVTFGATFKTLLDHYGVPDAYEINGDNLVLRYLSKYHVAFRLNRLETNHPYETTAIVVSGGKG